VLCEDLLAKSYWHRHIHRADLHRGLLDAATTLGCKMYLDSKVVKIDPSVPSLTTKNGEVRTADLIVASDGKLLEGCVDHSNNFRSSLYGS
jgi:salicylate hydroxylase